MPLKNVDMPDRFEQRLREKLGGYEAPFEPDDWSALSARMDAAERKPDRRVGYAVLVAALAGALGLGLWYQADLRSGRVPGAETATGLTAEDARPAAGRPAPTTTPAATASAAERAANAEGPSAIASDATADAGNAPASPGTTPGTAGFRPASGASGTSAAAPADERPSPRRTPAAGPSAATTRTPSASDPAPVAANRSGRPATSSSTVVEPRETDVRSGARWADELPPSVNAPVAGAALSAAAAGNTTAGPGTTAGTALSPEAVHPLAADALAGGLDDRPVDRSWPGVPEPERDFSLRKPPVRFALAGGPGLNAAMTGLGDGFRPAWDLGLAGEAWFSDRVFISAGLRYGVYRFHQVQVQCGDHAAHGLSENVHCPDAMLGDESLWEFPVRAGAAMDLAEGRGRLRGFVGLTTRIRRAADYSVEFHDVRAGDTLFFDPVVINVAGHPAQTQASNYSYDTDMFEALTTGASTMAPTSVAAEPVRTRTSLAVELGFGYEQFLAPGVSLGVEPRIDVPLSRLPMGGGRAYHLATTAVVRWYPGQR
jgi:hypothetical protein